MFIKIDQEGINNLKKNFPYVAIVILAGVVYNMFTILVATEDKRIQELKEQRDFYKDAFIQTSKILSHENSTSHNYNNAVIDSSAGH